MGGRLAGKYEILEPVGRGGMAEVYRGLARGTAGFSRPVAIKRILPSLAESPQFVIMFVEEARLGSQLHHPNIVQVYDFERDERGAFFLVMEWVEGLDLRRYLKTYADRGQPTPWHLVTALAIETLRGLAAAHERVDPKGQRTPIIHRDVTPQNVLLSTGGVAKLTDFGLAHAMEGARTTLPGIVKGKLSYLAPELTRGEPHSVRSDLFSMGVVLWEALAGRALYAGATDGEVFRAASSAEVPDLSSVRDDLPEGLGPILRRALAPRPEDRFSSARELLRSLARVLRESHHDTDSSALSQSIIEARCLLGLPPPFFATPQAAPPPPPAAKPTDSLPGELLSEDDLIDVL